MGGAGAEGMTWTRWRWRLRGATMWPVFTLCLVGEIVVLELLPLSGDATDPVDAFIVAGFLNVVVVAVLGPLASTLLRRRRPDLPRVVARDYAGTALLVALAVVLLGLGLAHRPAALRERRSYQAQSDALRMYVAHQAPASYRGNVNRADSIRIDSGLYRSCVPSNDPQQALCLFIDTSESPPGVRLDSNRAPNWRFFNRPGMAAPGG